MFVIINGLSSFIKRCRHRIARAQGTVADIIIGLGVEPWPISAGILGHPFFCWLAVLGTHTPFLLFCLFFDPKSITGCFVSPMCPPPCAVSSWVGYLAVERAGELTPLRQHYPKYPCARVR